MSNSSFISSSRPARARSPARRFLRRLSLFLLPLAVTAFLGTGIAIISGELIPVGVVAWLQTRGKPFVFLPEFSDHSYRLKLTPFSGRDPRRWRLDRREPISGVAPCFVQQAFTMRPTRSS